MTEIRLDLRNVLVDIDHVISDAFWRDPMIDNSRTSNEQWDEYHQASVVDKPNPQMVELLNVLNDSKAYWIVGLTARPEKWRRITMDWMIKHSVPMHALIMRPNDSYEATPKLKQRLIAEYYPNQLREIIEFVIEDRDDNVEAFRAMNLNVIQYYMRRQDV